MALLLVQNVTLRFGGMVSLDGVSFRASGDRLAARNGARLVEGAGRGTGVGEFVERAAFGQELLPAAAR